MAKLNPIEQVIFNIFRAQITPIFIEMKKLLFLLSLLPTFLLAQTCTGSLGDNIFLAGDFGAGVANVLLPNPGIAPGYFYNSSPPPSDGQYVITNNTGAWSGLYATWLSIQDNSLDPNGYMMVVNASFTPDLFYQQEVIDLCENTLYEFSADIINMIRMGVTDHINPNVTFLLDGVVQFTTGEIPSTNQWRTYGFTFTTGPNQTSATLALRNNAPGGIGNDLALDNLSFRACGSDAFILPDQIASICEDGDPLPLTATVVGELFDDPAVQWQISPDGFNNWTDIPGANDLTYIHTNLTLGFYYYRFQLANGPGNLLNEKCRINSNVKVVNVRLPDYFLQETICSGSSFEVGSSSYTSTGNYVDSLVNIYGCDSIVYLDLEVLPPPPIVATISITNAECFGTENGQLTIDNIVGGTPPYTVSFNQGLPDNTTVFTNLAGDTDYSLRITDGFGCVRDTSVFLPNPRELTLNLGGDQTLDLGELVSLRPTTNFMVSSYLWSSTAADLPCATDPDCPDLLWLPTASQQVVLTAVDDLGCTVTDSVFLTVNSIYEVYIPNVFSPNLDGVNDRFTIFGPRPRLSSIRQLQIFDRWGQLLFDGQDLEPGNLQQGWDGRAQGKAVSQGVYLYRLEVQFLDGVVKEFTGDVMVME
ncbi:MAG: hypothetical protein DA408_13550 [Bacteroidetes bacterium]|nr:MAG: hypothetical protein C7N36_20105 [Bacteroidota bacterium]PTM11432.1 MAG: hypothetical protein DA408_13550 [Bacteroidota bacterium]